MARTVICVETGQVFDSIKDAAEWLGQYPSSVSQVLRGLSSSAGGYHWVYADEEDAESGDHYLEPIMGLTQPKRTIKQVLAEAKRRTKQTGHLVTYGDIQIEETLALARNQTTLHKPKRRAK